MELYTPYIPLIEGSRSKTFALYGGASDVRLLTANDGEDIRCVP